MIESRNEINAELMDPITGEMIDKNDTDALIDAYERLKEAECRLAAYRGQLIQALTEKAPVADRKTVRIRGCRRRAKIEYPDDAWDQSLLKEAWHSFPKFREEFLSIGTIRVQLREWQKATNEAGPSDFEAFKALVGGANRGPKLLPRVTIEE